MTFAVGTPRVGVVNLGCRVNRVEADLIATQLIEAGCTIAKPADADAVVINTCIVTGEAQAKTRKTVRRMVGLPQSPQVVACGCAANLFADELLAAAPGLMIERDKRRVAHRVLELLGLEATSTGKDKHLALSPTPTGRMRPGIKIQDGCNNRCTYCIVWKARGASRSLDSSHIRTAVEEACARGAHEVVLTGINLGSYAPNSGGDLVRGGQSPLDQNGTEGTVPHGQHDLPSLLEYLLEATTIERIRLSSIEPPDVTERLLEVMASSDGRIAPFLHICLQSGCNKTLERMKRPYDVQGFARVIQTARDVLDTPALQTDVIAGFPGETDDDFEESLAFCKEMRFSKMHVFRYSKRPGTPAAVMPNQVDPVTANARAGRLRSLSRDMRSEFAMGLDGTCDRVLVLEPGRAVDSRQFEMVVPLDLKPGGFVEVTLSSNIQGQLEGKPLGQP